MNDIAEVNSSLNEYGFESYSFPAEVAEHDDLQALDLEFCKFAQATGTNYIEMCKRVAAIHLRHYVHGCRHQARRCGPDRYQHL